MQIYLEFDLRYSNFRVFASFKVDGFKILHAVLIVLIAFTPLQQTPEIRGVSFLHFDGLQIWHILDMVPGSAAILLNRSNFNFSLKTPLERDIVFAIIVGCDLFLDVCRLLFLRFFIFAGYYRRYFEQILIFEFDWFFFRLLIYET